MQQITRYQTAMPVLSQAQPLQPLNTHIHHDTTGWESREAWRAPSNLGLLSADTLSVGPSDLRIVLTRLGATRDRPCTSQSLLRPQNWPTRSQSFG